MKEVIRSKETNPLTRNLSVFLEPCGYKPVIRQGNAARFVHPVDDQNQFPKYELGLVTKDGKFNVYFALRKRPYQDDYLSPELGGELQRIIGIVEELRDYNPFRQSLLSALRHHLLFGTGDLIEAAQERSGVEPIEGFVSRIKRKKLRKVGKARWVERKYTDDTEYDF